MSKSKWAWVDLDDTLWDFRANSLIALRQVYEEKRLDRFFATCEEWIDSYHVVNDLLWTQYSAAQVTRDYLRMERFRRPLNEAGCDDALARQLSTELDPLYLGHLGELPGVVDGTFQLLERLHANGYRVGILSNGFKEVQYAKLHTSGIDKHIDCVVLSDEIDVNKPDARIYRYAEEKAQTTTEQCVMIGDNPLTDIGGALKAGWGAVWYNPNKKETPLEIANNPRLKIVTALSEIKVPLEC
jgi:putative hydrolase of the HAD superfamily